jgi:hypothetical protein
MFSLVMISTFVFYMLIRIVIAFRVENTETVRTLTLQHHTPIFHAGFSPSLMLLFLAGLIRIIIPEIEKSDLSPRSLVAINKLLYTEIRFLMHFS